MILSTDKQRAEYAEEMFRVYKRASDSRRISLDETSDALSDMTLAAKLLASRTMLKQLMSMDEDKRALSLSLLGATRSYEIACAMLKNYA